MTIKVEHLREQIEAGIAELARDKADAVSKFENLRAAIRSTECAIPQMRAEEDAALAELAELERAENTLTTFLATLTHPHGANQ